MNDIQGIAFQPPGGHLLPYLLLGLVLVGLAVWAYRKNPAPLSSGMRSLLWMLRGSAFLILVLLICRPMISLGAGKDGRRSVALLFDTSESLALPAGADPNGPSRAEAALEAVSGFLPGLKSRHAVRVYGFDRETRPLPDDAKDLAATAAARPSGDITGMGTAIESAVAEIGRARAGAIVVVSDGVSNHGLDPVAVSRRLALPVYTVGVGTDSVRKDAAVTRVRVNRTTFLGDEVPVSVTVRNQGLTGTSVELSIADVTRPEAIRPEVSQALTWAEDGAEQEIRLKFRPREVGLHFYEVLLPEVSGEYTGINNRRMFALDVREEKSRVLLLSGSLTWETTFLKRVLDADSSLSVTTMARLGNSWRNMDRATIPDRLSLNSGFLGPYALIVLMDMNGSHLQAADWEAMTDWVRRGGGLLVFGGEGSGGVRRLAGTALAPLLPVDASPGGGNGSTGIHTELSAAGGRHPVTLVDENEAENAALWSDLPPLEAPTTAPVVRGGGELLASGQGQENYPILVAGRSGSGKILCAPASGYWKWDFRLRAYQEKIGFYDRLWTNAVRWLTAPDLANRLNVEPGRPVFERGDAVDFSARLADREYQPLDGAEIRISIARADSAVAPAGDAARTLTLAGAGGGFYSGETGSLPPGRYRYQAEARRNGENVGDESGVFAVETMGLEFRRPGADPAFLARLAEETGGLFFPAAESGRLPEELKVQGPASQEYVTLDIWDSPWFFLLFVGLLSTEWFIRRRRGMV